MAELKKVPDEIFDQFFENSIDLLCIADTDGYFIKLNREWELTLGYKLKELEGKRFIDFIHPEDVEATIKATSELNNNQRINNFVNRFRHKDGTYRWIEWRSFSSKNLIYATARDITEKIEAEKFLKESEEHNKLIASLTTDYIFIVKVIDNNRLQLDYLSENYENITGRKIAEIKDSDSWKNLIYPDDYPGFLCFMQQIITNAQSGELECRSIAKGLIRWINITVKPTLDHKSGKIISIVGAVKDVTYRKETEIQLKLSEEKFSKAFFCTPDSVTITALSTGLYIDVNQVFLEGTGYKRHEVIGKSSLDLNLWVDIKDHESMVNTIKRDKQLRHFETKFRIRSGEIRDCLITGEIIEINHQICFLLFIRDITESKKAVNEIHLSEQKFRSIFENSTIGIAQVGLDGKYIMVNQALCRIFGYDADELLTFDIYKLTHPDDINKSNDLLNEAISEKGKEINVIKRYIHKDGRIIWANVSSKIIYDEQGLPLHFITHVVDISALKLAEEKTRESEEKFRIAFDNAPSGMSIIGPDGHTYLEVNPLLCKMFGYTKEEFLGKTIALVTHPEDEDASNEWIRKKMNDEPCEDDFEKRYIHKDGHIVWGSVRAKWIKNKDGSLQMVLAHILDITKRKLIEEELIRAKERAESSDRLKDAFLENLSHEIRTPLNAIVGFSDLLSNKELDIEEDLNNYTAIIKRSSNQLLSIVSDILTMASIQTGHEKIVKEPFDIHKLFDDIKEIYTPLTRNRSLELTVIKEKPDNVFHILTDGTKLTQIMINLMDNASKYTHEGFIEVKYTIKDKFIEFSVRDSGIGIAKEAHEYIFERFRQAEQSTHARYGGTGLGLSISKSFARMLDGSISVESEPGKGSKFYVMIPYLPFKNVVKTKRASASKFTKSLLTILVAEDEINNFLLIKTIIREKGVKLIHALDGYEAVQMCQSNPKIDLVLMDIKMPVMDGIQAFQEIQRIRKDLPVIAQTAYALEKDKREFINMGFADYIAKPIKKEDLISKISKVVMHTTA